MKWREAVKRKLTKDIKEKPAETPAVDAKVIEKSSSGRVYVPLEAPTLLKEYRKKAVVAASKKKQSKEADAALKEVKEKVLKEIPEGNNAHFGDGKVYHKSGGTTKTVNMDMLHELVIFAQLKGGDVKIEDIVTIKAKKDSWIFDAKI